MQFLREFFARKVARDPADFHLAELRIHDDVARAGLLLEETLDQPHAAGAGNALDIAPKHRWARAGGLLGLRLQLGEPFEITGLEYRRIHGRRELVFEPVVAIEAVFVNEAVNVSAAGTAEA